LPGGSRGLGDVYKRQMLVIVLSAIAATALRSRSALALPVEDH
jgi:hypothetical protein